MTFPIATPPLSPAKPTPTVAAIMNELFNRAREPRSDIYKAGVRAALQLHIEGHHIVNPYLAGRPEFEAFFAGVDEGHFEAHHRGIFRRNHLENT